LEKFNQRRPRHKSFSSQMVHSWKMINRPIINAPISKLGKTLDFCLKAQDAQKLMGQIFEILFDPEDGVDMFQRNVG
jgi:hypothetical protein